MPILDDVMPSQRTAAPAEDDVLPSQRGAATGNAGDDLMPSQRPAPPAVQRPSNDPNAPGGFNYGGKNTKISPDQGLGEELSDLTEPIGRQLNTAGNVTRGVLADVGTLPINTGAPKFRNTAAAWNGKDLPMDAEAKALPTPLRVINAGVQGLVKTAPNLALTALNPVAGAASFGMTPDGFDVKQAAVAAALPVLGKYTGAITEAIASKAGVTKDAALAIWNRIGGAAGAAGAIGADQVQSILQLPEDQRKDAIIEAAGNVGSMFILGATGERTTLADTAAGKLVNKLRGPSEADNLESELGTTSSKQPDAPANPNLKSDLTLLQSVMDDIHRPLAAAQIGRQRAAAKAASASGAEDTLPSQRPPEPTPEVEPPGPSPVLETTPTPADQIPLIPVDVPDEDVKAAAKQLRGDAAPDILDEVQPIAKGPVQFDPEHFGTVVEDARGETMPKGRPTAATGRFDDRVSATAGTPADEVLKGLVAENPKYADWTPDQLAQEMIAAHNRREGTGDALDGQARALVQEEARTQQFQRTNKPGRAGSEPVPASQLFIGDRFKVNGHEMEVTGHATDAETGRPGHVELAGAYGRQNIPATGKVHIDEGSLKSPAAGGLGGVLAKVEKWSDEVLRGGGTHAGTDVLAAYMVKGVLVYARGIRDFAKWSAEMVSHLGEAVKPHLDTIWKTINDPKSELGLSARGLKIVSDTAIDQGVREKINPVYQKLTDMDAKDQALAIGKNYATADAMAQDMLNGKFKDAPGGIEVALLAHVARRLAEEQKLAERAGDTAKADALAQRQIDLLNRYREQSTDIAQALQKHQLLYENFSPAAWLKDFRDLVGKVAARRVEQAAGLPQGTVEVSPHGITKAIAARIAKELEPTHPKLAQAIREFFANPPGGSLADYLKSKGLAEAGKADAAARKLEKVYSDQVAKWRKRNNIPVFDAATEKEVLRRAKAVDGLPRDSVQRATATQDLQNWLATKRGFEWWESAREFWYANVLSGLTTAEKIFRSNALSAGAEIGLQMMRHPTAIPQILEATARSIPRSAAEAWRITKTGMSGRPGDVFDHSSWMETRKGPAAAMVYPWKIVFRTHHALHALTYYPLEETKALVLSREAVKRDGVPVFGGELGKAAAQKMQWLGEQRQDAARQAQAEGLKPGGPLYNSRVDQILSQRRDKTVMINAQQFAQMGTYVNDMYGMVGAAGDQFNKFAQNYPVARLVQPFVKIPINLFNGMMNWTPVGAYRAARGQGFKLLIGREGNTGKLYGREVTDPTAIGDLYAKATIGTLATVGLMSAASAFVNEPNPPFMVTARGPNDLNHRRLLEQAGWIPNSVKVGNTYYPYLDTPVGVVLSYIGHTMDALRYNKLDHDDALSRAMFAASSIRSVIFDSTWAQGLSALFDSGSYQSNKNLGEKGMQQAIRTASGFVVPNILKQLDQIYDPTVYKADDIRAMTLTQIPFARSNGEPDLNVFGQPVLNPLSSRILSQVQGDALIQTLAGRRIWPSVPLDPDLTPKEQRLILLARGPQLRAQLQAQLPMIKALPQAEAQTLVNNISRKTTEAAKKELGFDNLLRARRAANR